MNVKENLSQLNPMLDSALICAERKTGGSKMTRKLECNCDVYNEWDISISYVGNTKVVHQLPKHKGELFQFKLLSGKIINVCLPCLKDMREMSFFMSKCVPTLKGE